MALFKTDSKILSPLSTKVEERCLQLQCTLTVNASLMMQPCSADYMLKMTRRSKD